VVVQGKFDIRVNNKVHLNIIDVVVYSGSEREGCFILRCNIEGFGTDRYYQHYGSYKYPSSAMKIEEDVYSETLILPEKTEWRHMPQFFFL
jgi:hypothetical protein